MATKIWIAVAIFAIVCCNLVLRSALVSICLENGYMILKALVTSAWRTTKRLLIILWFGACLAWYRKLHDKTSQSHDDKWLKVALKE